MTTQSNNGIPMPVKDFTWILICAGTFFFYVYTFNPVISFPDANLDSYSARMGFASAGVRILGSVLSLLISVICNNPRFLLIALVMRVFIELADVVLGVTIGGTMTNNIGLCVLASVEIWAVVQLSKVVKWKE